jgi:cytochrome c biogenesis protein CcmG/thiol:disulfide interchange protein DsbE
MSSSRSAPLFLLLAACASPTVDLPEPGPPAPDFDVVAVDGREVSLAALRGKVVMLHFWARWCGACAGDLEIFQDLHAKYAGRGLAVVGLAHASGPDDEVQRFADALDLGFPNVQVTDELRATWLAAMFPTTVVVDRDGRVRYRATGRLNPGFWDRLVEGLLREGAASSE